MESKIAVKRILVLCVLPRQAGARTLVWRQSVLLYGVSCKVRSGSVSITEEWMLCHRCFSFPLLDFYRTFPVSSMHTPHALKFLLIAYSPLGTGACSDLWDTASALDCGENSPFVTHCKKLLQDPGMQSVTDAHGPMDSDSLQLLHEHLTLYYINLGPRLDFPRAFNGGFQSIEFFHFVKTKSITTKRLSPSLLSENSLHLI